jgi:hypothetical protein
MTALLVLYMVNQLLLPGHVEQVADFGAAVGHDAGGRALNRRPAPGGRCRW